VTSRKEKDAMGHDLKHDGLTEFKRGLELLEACEYERARSEFTKSLKRAPAEQRGLVHSMRAQAAALLLDWEAVIDDATMAIRLNPVLNLALALRGRAHSALGRHCKALVDFTKLLEINPADAFAYLSRGRVHLLLGHHLVAIAEFNKAQRLEPTLERLHLYRSEAYFALGQWTAAIKAASEAIRLDDCPAVAYYVRATCRQERGEHNQAVEDLTKVIELWPVAAAYWARAVSYRELGDEQLAAADEQAAVKLAAPESENESSEGHDWLGLHAIDAASPN
jgi:tetratricopeptide (TPR) repeat protein